MSKQHLTHKATNEGRIETIRRRHARITKYGSDLRHGRTADAR